MQRSCRISVRGRRTGQRRSRHRGVAGETVTTAPTGFLVRLVTEPMWVLGLVLFMDEVDKNVVRGMITPLKEEFGVGDVGIGVLLSLALLFNGVITVPAGYLADRWNRSRAIDKTVVGWSVLTAGGAASVGIRTVRYALAGVAALLFTVTALAAWLPQYYERHLHLAEGTREALFTALVIFGGIPGVLLGGRVADRYAPKMQGGRLALPALFIAGGNLFFTAAYLLRSDEYSRSLVTVVFALQLFGIVIMTMSIPGPGRDHRRRPRPPAGRRVRSVQPRGGGVRAGRRALRGVADLRLLRREPTGGVTRLLPSAVPRRRHSVPGGRYLDDDMNKIMMAVLQALQDERDREAESAAGQGVQPT